uniref:Uncharacterized protein n=1 Tax=Anguilla anguilla TaxID=7936 RepID=A0A0E9UIY3_ANGAN
MKRNHYKIFPLFRKVNRAYRKSFPDTFRRCRVNAFR